jgi:hypothetical protein
MLKTETANLPNRNRYDLTMALTTADCAPWIQVEDGDNLFPPFGKWVVKPGLEAGWLLPSFLWIPKEHAKEMTATTPASAICGTRVHDAEVIDELNIAVLPVKLGAILPREVFNCLQCMQLVCIHLWDGI